jgi:hypothetical protein
MDACVWARLKTALAHVLQATGVAAVEFGAWPWAPANCYQIVAK